MKKLRMLRKRLNISQSDMARLLGIAQNSYSRYENGQRQPSIEMLQKMSEILCVSIDDLVDDADEKPIGREVILKPEIEYEDEVWIPVVASLHCGYGASGEPYTIIDRQKVPKSYKSRYGDDLVLNYATGDSMFPTIKSGDLMLCYPGNMWDDGTIVILNVNGSDTVKRIYHAVDGGIDLIPDNSKYKIIHYTPEDIRDLQISVLGHVITVMPKEFAPIPRRKA